MRCASAIVAAALAGAVAATACAAERAASPGAIMRVDGSGSGTRVRLRPGEALEVVLAETPTTGYRWKVVRDGSPVLRLDADRFAPPGPRPGAPGSRAWTFSVAQPGPARLELVYVRSWEAGEPARRFTLDVDAR